MVRELAGSFGGMVADFNLRTGVGRRNEQQTHTHDGHSGS